MLNMTKILRVSNQHVSYKVFTQDLAPMKNVDPFIFGDLSHLAKAST